MLVHVRLATALSSYLHQQTSSEIVTFSCLFACLQDLTSKQAEQVDNLTSNIYFMLMNT